MTFSGPIAAFSEKWYFPNYFRNSALLLNISKINANGPFWPRGHGRQCLGAMYIFSSLQSSMFLLGLRFIGLVSSCKLWPNHYILLSFFKLNQHIGPM